VDSRLFLLFFSQDKRKVRTPLSQDRIKAVGNTHQSIRENRRGIAAQRQYYFVRHSFSEGGLGKREKCMDVFVLESKATILVPP